MRVRLTDAGQAVRGRVIDRRRVLITEALAATDGRLPSDLPDGLGAIAEALIRRA